MGFSGPDSLTNLKRLAQKFQSQEAPSATIEDDDDDVPTLVDGNFEDASKEKS